MAATIKIKNSSTAGAAPTSSDLVQGELAVNVTDKRLYTENASGTIVELGTNPSVPVTFPDGSASAPSLTNDGDTNTGLFFPAADTVGISTGGTERARVDSSGNLGLGVTPSAWSSATLQTASDSGYGPFGYTRNGYYDGSNFKYISSTAASRYAQSGGAHLWFNAASGTAGNAISFTQAMTLDSSGRLLVGLTSSQGGTVQSQSTVAGTQCYLSWNSATSGTRYFHYFVTGAGATAVGSITTDGTTTTYATSSDYRLKEVSGSLTGYKERLSALQPKQGTWKENGAEFRGFLAHEFATSYPSSVNGEKDAVDENGNPKYQGMQAGSSEVIADLVALLQEQQAIIESLTARIEALEQA